MTDWKSRTMVGKGCGLVVVISLLQLDDGVHQRFGDVLSAVHAKAPVRIRQFSALLARGGDERRHFDFILDAVRLNAGADVHAVRVQRGNGVCNVFGV